MKISEIILKLTKYHPTIDESHTCDTVKIGDPNQECTGIVVTTFASVEVIRQAIATGANFIIVHEPLFYSDKDATEWLKDNSVYQEKVKLLNDHGIVVWRDHDRIHGGSPAREREHMDLIFYGIMKTLGWEKYNIGFHLKPMLYEIPECTVKELALELKQKLRLSGTRIVGNPEARIRRVFFCEHIMGRQFGGHDKDAEAIMEIEEGNYDVMLPFEIIDWSLSEYVRDAAQLGKNKAMIEIGHFNLEEAGMKYMVEWLPEVIGESVPIDFIQSGDSFSYI